MSIQNSPFQLKSFQSVVDIPLQSQVLHLLFKGFAFCLSNLVKIFDLSTRRIVKAALITVAMRYRLI